MLIVANPIYDVVFKALMDDEEVACGILSALTGLNIIGIRFIPQEHVRKDIDSGDLHSMRMDFCAIVKEADGRSYQILIELQKAKYGSNPLRFRYYLANRYAAEEPSQTDGKPGESLPIISIYMLGYMLDTELPMATRVIRHYHNAVTKEKLSKGVPHEFIEQLTHDAIFIQIPLIIGNMDTEMEQVLSAFDQHNILGTDQHRLEFPEKACDASPLLKKIFRTLNKLQASPEMDILMDLEDLYLREQRQAVDEVRFELRQERKLREEEHRKREEAEGEREEEQRKREEAEGKREEAEGKREEAEGEVKRLRKLLGDGFKL